MSILSTAQGLGNLLTGSYLSPASSVTTEVTGLSRLEAGLAQLPEMIAKKALIGAVRDAAKVFQDRAVQLAPYDPEVPLGHPEWRTMHLRDEITLRTSTRSLGAAGSEASGLVGVDAKHAFFARFVEQGHISASGGQVAPHPFMRPAFQSAKDEALARFRASLADRIEAILGEVFR
jgi:HK97 gp10 family phage protein